MFQVLNTGEFRRIVLIVAGFLVAHLVNISLPMVNLEYAFVNAAQYFLTEDKLLIELFFDVQANPVALSYLASKIAYIMPDTSLLVIIRGLSVASVILLTIGVMNICRFVGRQDHTIIVALLLFNPLVWTFSTRATTDFISAAVGIFAISIVLKHNHRLWRAVISGLLLGLATLLKYHALSLSVVLMALLLFDEDKKSARASFVIIVIIALAMLGTYLVVIHDLFGFWIIPDKFQMDFVKHTDSNPLSKFVVYAGYLVLMAGVLPILNSMTWSFFKPRHLILLPVILAIFISGLFGIRVSGEMAFGPFDDWLNLNVMNGILAILAAGVFIPLLLFIGKKNHSNKLMASLSLAVIIILLAFSLTRPAQRYLMFVLPVFMIALPVSVYRSRLILSCIFGVFITVNATLGYNQWRTGGAAEQMLSQIEQAGLGEVTDIGTIWSHVGFPLDMTERKYVVVPGEHPDATMTSKKGFANFQKSYSLIPTAPPNPNPRN